MPKVQSRMTERIRVAEYSHLEYEVVVTDDYGTKEEGMDSNRKVLDVHFAQFRKDIKKAFKQGKFDLTD